MIAATIPLCAPQRHKLPLIRSRSSSWLSAIVSDSEVGGDVARHAAPHFVRHPHRRADLPRRAVAALKPVMLDERLLQTGEARRPRRALRSWSASDLRTEPPGRGTTGFARRRPGPCRHRMRPGHTPSSCPRARVAPASTSSRLSRASNSSEYSFPLTRKPLIDSQLRLLVRDKPPVTAPPASPRDAVGSPVCV